MIADFRHIANLRHSLHEHPDISGKEQYAHDLIVSELTKLAPSRLYKNVGGRGVVAVWHSTSQQDEIEAVAFRADIDALPIGHRCGHDGHTAILLALAHYIHSHVDRKKDIILLFQPEEEVGMGAKKMLDSGILQQYNVKQIFGFHNLPGVPIGKIVLNDGIFAAASTGFVLHLHGRPTHASTPELGINPGLAVADIIQRMSKLNRSSIEDVDAFGQATLICCRVGEEAFGTSAGDATLMFTLRACRDEVLDQMLVEVQEMARTVSETYGLRWSYELREPFKATVNNAACVAWLQSVCEKNKIDYIKREEPFRWSEDFAEYLLHFDGAYVGIGSGETVCELHHPDYDFPDALIVPATSFWETVVRNL